MKKGFKTLAAAALAVSALTPVAAAAANDIAPGVYTSTNYYSVTDFKKLSTADKNAVLTSPGAVVVVAGQVYKSNDVLSATNTQLPTLGKKADEYTTPEGNKLVSGKPINSTPEQLKVESVSAVNQTVYSTGTQELTVQINGNQSVTVKQLTDAGYTLNFTSDKAVFAGTTASTTSTDGKLKSSFSSTETSFKYSVTVTKDGKTVESATAGEVKVIDANTTATITEYELKRNTTKLTGTTITLADDGSSDDKKITLKATKGTDIKGNEKTSFTTAKYSSSNNEIALVDANGKITPVKPGTVTITITDGNATKAVTVTIAKDAQKLTKVTADKTSVGVVVGNTASVTIKGYDQYNEEITSLTDENAITVQSSDSTIFSVTGTGTATVTAVKAGKANLVVKSSTGATLLAIPVTIGTGTVAVKKLELGNTTAPYSKDATLDVNSNKNDSKIELVYNGYTADGLLVAAQQIYKATSDPKEGSKIYYEVVTGTPATVTDNNIANKIDLTAKNAGTATVNIYEGSLKVASYTITVQDTKPTVTAATFETVSEITSTDDTAVLKVSSLTFSSNVTGAKFAVPGSGTTGEIQDGSGVKVGTYEVLSDLTSADTVSVNVTSDDTLKVSVTHNDTTKANTGNITIRIKNNKGDIVTTRTYRINIPKK